jgi:small nuclear ribonucleoprotein B and B'
VQLHDSSKDRYLVGTLISFDKHMNLVLVDTEEYRKIKHKRTKNQEEIKGEGNEP